MDSQDGRPPALSRFARSLTLARKQRRQLSLKIVSLAWPPNAALVARHGAALTTAGTPRGDLARLDLAIDEALGWLCRSQDRVGSGGVGCYEFYSWTTGYPEVTGYIIPTLWDCHHQLGRKDLAERAVRMADWELRIQQPEGGFAGGYEGDGSPPVVFNTGQVIRGLLRSADETGDERYLDAAVRAGRWIVANQEADGSWARANFKGMKRVYDSYVSAPLAQLAAATGDETFAAAAIRNCEFVLSQQRPNGWFELCDNNPLYLHDPLTHTICYTVDGLLETGETLGEERFVEAAVRAADAMLELVEQSPALPARLGENWEPHANYVCVTGAAQLGVILMRLHERGGDARQLAAGRELATFLLGLQGMNGIGPSHRGALPGSFPVWGFYCPFKLPSWGTKYLVDLLLQLRATGAAAGPRATRPHVAHLTAVHRSDDVRIFGKECRTLAAAGYDVHLVAPGNGSARIDEVQLHTVRPTSASRFRRMTGTAIDVYRAARALDADVYHVHDPELIPVALMLRRGGARVVYDSHEHLPQQILTKPWIPLLVRRPVAFLSDAAERFAARRVSAVVTAEPYVRERFEGKAPVTRTVNNFPRLEEFATPDGDWSEKENAVCYAGGITEIRGGREMVQAIARTDAKLLLAGAFTPPAFQEELAREPGWDQVEVLGHLPRREVADMMGRARAGLVVLWPIPNYLQANPTKMFEYMAARIPVIASNFPAWATIVEKHECGLCVDPNSPDQIAQAIEWILEHPREAQRMGENGRRAVEQFYNWDVERETLLGLYEELVGPAS
jgi:glycosyltransferase involved in cell wall biosynthesis